MVFVCQILMVWLLLLFHRIFGKDFAVDTHVTFLVHGQPQTGVVTKQLKMPLSSKLTKRKNNHLMVHSNGVIVINYKQLKRFNSSSVGNFPALLCTELEYFPIRRKL